MTQRLTAVTGDIAAGTDAGQAGQIQAARDAVDATMTEIGNLKGAEGLSDTVVDAIEILENAWNELKEVQLGTATVGTVAQAAITGVTQEQVDTLREAVSNLNAAFERANKLNSAQTVNLLAKIHIKIKFIVYIKSYQKAIKKSYEIHNSFLFYIFTQSLLI